MFEDELVVGRASLGDAVAHDQHLSRRHARFFLGDDGRVHVEDLGSTNGTFVNGSLIDGARELKLGDEIRLSDTTLELMLCSADVGGVWRRPEPDPEPGPPPLRPGPRERLAAQRDQRMHLPPFPNFTQVPSLLSIRTWWVIRAAGLAATLTVVVLLFAAPSTGLRVTWEIGVPLLPILFFVAPGIWRNICPLAASNQLPRVLGFTRGMTAPAWLKRYAYAISIALFVAFISLRKVGLETDGTLTGLLLLGALAAAFTGGFFAKGKSGWCSSICPLLPVQRIYAQTPFALVTNTHCQPCLGCTKNCYDFNPRVAYLADLHDQDEGWSAARKFFVAAFPGLVLGFFEVADVPEISVLAVYGQLALYTAVGVMAFFLLDAFSGLTTHRLTTLYAALALNVFYWYGFPVLYAAIGGAPAPDAVTWAARAALVALSGTWVLRTYVKERAFMERAGRQQPRPGAAARRSRSTA